MAASGSTKVIMLALGANALIATAKFTAAAWTGSAAMLSEAIHSLADTANQGLLLHGTRQAGRPADARHPFGYARELYFWSFVVAVLLFSLGSGVAMYEGIHKLRHPEPVTDPWINYAVLTFALICEAGSAFVALREFNSQRGSAGTVQALRGSKDPALFTVLLEDLAAIAGLLIALAGLVGAQVLGWTAGDAIASIIIGIVLGLVAAFMAIEIKALLIGEAAAPEIVAAIETMIREEMGADGPIRHLDHLKTMHLGPGEVLVAATLAFSDQGSAVALQATVARLEAKIQARFPQVRHLYLEAQAPVAQAAGGHAGTGAEQLIEHHLPAAQPPVPRPAAGSASPGIRKSNHPPVKKHKNKKHKR